MLETMHFGLTREGMTMMDRREFLLGSIGAGIAAAGGGGFATAQKRPIQFARC
jgi:hypothetical protein